MNPFFPSLPGQIQPQSGNNPAPQQAMLPNPHQFIPSSSSSAAHQNPPGFNHPHHVPPLPHGQKPHQFPSSSSAHQNPAGFNRPPQIPPLHNGQNPRFRTPSMNNFNTQNTQINNFNRSNAGIPNRPNSMPPPCFPNAPNVPHLNQIRMPHPQGQFGLQHHQAQNVNQIMAALQVLQQNLPQLQGHHNLLGQLQNTNLAAFLQPGGVFCAPNMQAGQLCLQNPLMSGNQISPFQFPQQFPANIVQPLNIPPSSQPLMASTSSQNPGHVCNPQMGLVGSNPNFGNAQNQDPRLFAAPNTMGLAGSNPNFGNGILSNEGMMCKNQDPRLFAPPTTMGQNAIQESPAATQKSQPPVSPFTMQTHQTWNNMQRNGHQQPQVNHVHGYGKREPTNMRSQNSQFHHAKHTKVMVPFTKNSGRGQQNKRERNQLTKCPTQAQTEQRRPLPVCYTAKELQQWREARKRNFPTSDHTEKKLTRRSRDQDSTDGEVQLRRQQLKEILAKQAELGVEVAEIPPGYLSEPTEQIGKRKNLRWSRSSDGHVPNKYNKRGRRSRDGRHPKKPRIGNEASTSPIANVKEREPTLLQKLLSADIKRDNSRLLQAFRFMVLNSFFEHWPNKPLEFLSVTVKGTGCESNDIAMENEPSLDVVDAAGFVCRESAMDVEIDGLKDQSVVDEDDNKDSDNDDTDGDGKDDVDEDAAEDYSHIDNKEVANHPRRKEGGHVGEQYGKSEEGEITE